MHHFDFVTTEIGGETPNRLRVGRKPPLSWPLSWLRREAGGTENVVYQTCEGT
jgi:hypothetical protein